MTSQSSTLSSQPSIQLHIERLVLEGLPGSPAQGPAVGAAVEAELVRLLSAEGLSAAVSRHEPHLPTSDTHLAAERGPSNLGQQIGPAIYQVLNPSRPQSAIQNPP